MLDNTGTRQLAYIVTINEIKPIEGKDRVECAVVGGWTIMVRKDQFKPGDLGIYFEIDSKVPETEPFAFLESKHYRIKTQKYSLKDVDGNKCGQFWSQGLLMAAEDFGWTLYQDGDGQSYIHDAEKNISMPEGYFLTETFGVTYAVEEDNKRKANSEDKYKKMAQRNSKLFSHQPFRWLMRRTWGKKLLFVFFGNKKDQKNTWPEWVKKTDEERIQNMPWILNNKEPWIVTEKIDGTSTTFSLKRGKRGKYHFYICSRNVVFDKPDKKCFYETNVYTEMAEKYDIENKLKNLLETNDLFSDADWITLQGETYGPGIQKRDYSMPEHCFMGFNLISSDLGRLNSVVSKGLLEPIGIPWVPIVDENYILPDTVEELLNVATDKSMIDGDMREGLVFRSQDGTQSFKAVSNEFLIKYHN